MNKKAILQALILFLVVLTVYLYSQAKTIYGGDAGDLVSAIITRGIPHPPGYPLYVVFGILIDLIIETGTPAYKAAFLSSIPAALSIAVLYLLLKMISGKNLESAITALFTAFLYPVYLYAAVPEVFALNNLFTVILTFTFFAYRMTGKLKYFLTGIFFLSFSISHHHTVIFLIPALFYLSFPLLKKLGRKQIIKMIIPAFSGLVPYLYVFISAGKSPAVNWMGEPTSANFLNLFFRTNYGTFTAGAFINPDIISRFLNVFAFFEFLLRDFTLIGILLIFSGFIYFYKFRKVIFNFTLISLVSFLFLLFYASFPLRENFMLATFERYVITPYILMAIPFCFGLSAFRGIIGFVPIKLMSQRSIKAYSIISGTVLCILPLLLFVKSFRKISPLRHDFTAENFANDILESTGGKGILLLAADTPLFNSQYEYFSKKRSGELVLVHFAKLAIPNYINQLNRQYPQKFFKKAMNEDFTIDDLLTDLENQDVYSIQSYSVGKGRWIPWGLIYKYLPDPETADLSEIIRINENLWNKYHDPLGGSLAQYENLFLSDVLNWYAAGRLETAFFEAKNGRPDLVAEHIREAKKLNGNDPNSYIILAQILIADSKCTEADNEIKKLTETNPKDNIANYLYYLNYQKCFKDEITAAEFLSAFEKNQKQKETPLKML